MTDTNAPATAADASRYPLRRILILIVAFAAPLIGYGQMALGIGMTPSDFSAQGDDTLRVAGYAFSIWALIYGWLFAYAIYQALPATTENESLRRVGWPSFYALAGIGLWVVASAANWQWATVAIIMASLLVLLVPLVQNAKLFRSDSIRRRALTAWPLGLLAGWLTIASLVNLLTVMTSQDLIAPGTGPLWALGAVALAALAALGVTARTRLWTYPVPIAWGLIGVFFAGRTDGQNLIAFAALGAALLIVVGVTLILARAART
ncbi:MAG: hypothetical protein J0L52_12410 [Caulobacterales bacterium]|nr:hypothetical protein [Caulobacterales bacterium]